MKRFFAIVLILVLSVSTLAFPAAAVCLAKGSTGTAVRYLEMNLKALGFFDGTPNTRYDSATRLAVIAYQRSRGLDDDGIAGDITLGSIDDEIRSIQKMLNDTGYPCGEEDGVAGTKFTRALRSLQSRWGLPETGCIDDETCSALYSEYYGMEESRGADESASYPTSVDEAEDMLILSKKEKSVKAGSIRYIAQVTSDKYFVKNYYKYTVGSRSGYLNSSDKCTRCALSMCLSYIGIDVDPGYMSTLLGSININSPVRDVPNYIAGVQRVNDDDFEALFDNYASDDSYTPLLVYFDYKSSHHAIVVYGFDGEYYLAADSAANKTHVIRVKFNDDFTRIIESPDYGKYTSKNKVTAVCQWVAE